MGTKAHQTENIAQIVFKMDKIKIELTLDELHIIMNILTVKSLSGNLDDEDRVLGRKIHQSIKKLEKGGKKDGKR